MTEQSATPLSPRLTELVQYATTARGQLEDFVKDVPPSLHTARAAAERWTVAEHIEHLGLIEDSIGRLISSMAKKLRADDAIETEHSSMLGSLDSFDLPAASRKLIAPVPYRPTGELSASDAMEKLRGIRTRVLEGVNKANGLDLTQSQFPHPYFGPLNGYQWLLLVAQHELRHLNQMKQDIQNLTATPTVAAPAAPQGSL